MVSENETLNSGEDLNESNKPKYVPTCQNGYVSIPPPLTLGRTCQIYTMKLRFLLGTKSLDGGLGTPLSYG